MAKSFKISATEHREEKSPALAFIVCNSVIYREPSKPFSNFHGFFFNSAVKLKLEQRIEQECRTVVLFPTIFLKIKCPLVHRTSEEVFIHHYLHTKDKNLISSPSRGRLVKLSTNVKSLDQHCLDWATSAKIKPRHRHCRDWH